MVGFDFARTFNPSATLGTAQGMVNMGGFVASLLVMQAMGLILGAAGGYSFESFRLAWTVQYAVWALAVVGILITRRKARRLMRAEQERMLLESFDARRRRTDSPASDCAPSRRLAFMIADTNSSLFIVERPAMSSRRATSIRCFFDAFASTPSADLALGIRTAAAGPRVRRPFLSLGSQ